MAEFEFRQVGGGMFAVNLDGRRVGQIVNVPGGWQYQPAVAGPNHRFVGKVYARLAACKRSVTGEDTDDDRG